VKIKNNSTQINQSGKIYTDNKCSQNATENGGYEDYIFFGHTHNPYHRMLPTENMDDSTHYRHAINIGTVGKPKDGKPKGCYVILTINQDSSIYNKEAVQVAFIRFEYDVEKAAKAVEESPLPNGYADMLRKGYQGNKKFADIY
jgi:diadenosine tetraphosphatase ApaH/serine/threonine PP2A family protein phosphatase